MIRTFFRHFFCICINVLSIKYRLSVHIHLHLPDTFSTLPLTIHILNYIHLCHILALWKLYYWCDAIGTFRYHFLSAFPKFAVISIPWFTNALIHRWFTDFVMLTQLYAPIAVWKVTDAQMYVTDLYEHNKQTFIEKRHSTKSHRAFTDKHRSLSFARLLSRLRSNILLDTSKIHVRLMAAIRRLKKTRVAIRQAPLLRLSLHNFDDKFVHASIKYCCHFRETLYLNVIATIAQHFTRYLRSPLGD